jgi:hypothetical protein
MKKLFFCILLIFSGAADLHAQNMDRRVERRLVFLDQNVAPLYRKPTARELKTVAPNPALLAKYAGFLRQPKTGLTKLIDDKGCAENTKVVVATENCLKYTMPGAGSSFSFRAGRYRIPRLADITFTNKSFLAAGVLLHGIFVNLGDVPLEQATLRTKGLKYLVEFQPETDYEKGVKIDAQLIRGVRQDGFLYRRGLYMDENATFALRSIAYEGKYYRAVRNVTYNELDFDERKDIIVVFRIVEKDADDNVTILWKLLQEKDSPEVKRRKAIAKT